MTNDNGGFKEVCVKCLLAFYCNFQISYIAWNILVDVEPYFNATGYTSPVIIRLLIPQRAHLFHGPLDNEPLAICFFCSSCSQRLKAVLPG